MKQIDPRVLLSRRERKELLQRLEEAGVSEEDRKRIARMFRQIKPLWWAVKLLGVIERVLLRVLAMKMRLRNRWARTRRQA